MNFFLKIRRLLPLYRFGCLWAPMIGDEIFDGLIVGRSYEQNEIDFVKSFLDKGNSFLDIGANFGLYSIIAAKIVGKNGKVFSIEPEPRNLKRLKRNLILNRVSVDVIPIAVGETEGEVEFCSCSQGAYSGLKLSTVPGKVKKIMVPKNTLDNLSERYHWSNIDLLKMDVEGAELLVLMGGELFFQKTNRPVILIEFNDNRSAVYGWNCSQVYNWLIYWNYDFFSFNSEGNLIPHVKKEYYGYENLVVIPKEKLGLMIDHFKTVKRGMFNC